VTEGVSHGKQTKQNCYRSAATILAKIQEFMKIIFLNLSKFKQTNKLRDP
jgi:hypothetical protein